MNLKLASDLIAATYLVLEANSSQLHDFVESGWFTLLADLLRGIVASRLASDTRKTVVNVVRGVIEILARAILHDESRRVFETQFGVKLLLQSIDQLGFLYEDHLCLAMLDSLFSLALHRWPPACPNHYSMVFENDFLRLARHFGLYCPSFMQALSTAYVARPVSSILTEARDRVKDCSSCAQSTRITYPAVRCQCLSSVSGCRPCENSSNYSCITKQCSHCEKRTTLPNLVLSVSLRKIMSLLLRWILPLSIFLEVSQLMA